MGQFAQAFERVYLSIAQLTTDEAALKDAQTHLAAAEADIEAAVEAKIGDLIQAQLTAAVTQVQNTPPAGLAIEADLTSLTARVAALEGNQTTDEGDAAASGPAPVVDPPVVTDPVVTDPVVTDPVVVPPVVEEPAA